MKDIQEVKRVRNALQSQLNMFEEKRRQFSNDGSISMGDMAMSDRRIMYYLTQSIKSMRIQIDALTFVINEDACIEDVANDRYYREVHEISRETVFTDEDYLYTGQLDERQYMRAMRLRNEITSVGDKRFFK